MLEKELNHDLVALFKTAGWAYKIPDPSQESAISSSKRPFDGLAYFEDIGNFYFESKLDKHKLQAFSLTRESFTTPNSRSKYSCYTWFLGS